MNACQGEEHKELEALEPNQTIHSQVLVVFLIGIMKQEHLGRK